MAGGEFDALCADIKANGLNSPVVIHDGMILDGGNRYRACLELGIESEFVEFAGGNLVAFVLSANLHRRHMSTGQQAAIVASAQDWSMAQSASRPEKAGNVTGLSTVADRMAQSGASDKTQRMADKVAKASPDLAKQVAHGEKSLPAAIKEITPPKPVAETEYAPGDHEADELAETIRILSEENDALKDRLAVELMPVSEEEKTVALDTICGLRQEVKRLEIENRALIASRDSYQRDNGELKSQCAMQRKQIAKLQQATA